MWKQRKNGGKYIDEQWWRVQNRFIWGYNKDDVREYLQELERNAEMAKTNTRRRSWA